MSLDIIAAESLGVRGLCCVATLPGRRIVIDPGIALGYLRHGLLPHPLQIAVERAVRASDCADPGERHGRGAEPFSRRPCANSYPPVLSLLPVAEGWHDDYLMAGP